jgi:hypothetical protein
MARQILISTLALSLAFCGSPSFPAPSPLRTAEAISASPSPSAVPLPIASPSPRSAVSALPMPSSEISVTATYRLYLPMVFRQFALSSHDEWTQHAHDAQRTSYTSQIVPPPWRWKWAWNGPDAQGRVSPGKFRLPRNSHRRGTGLHRRRRSRRLRPGQRHRTSALESQPGWCTSELHPRL